MCGGIYSADGVLVSQCEHDSKLLWRPDLRRGTQSTRIQDPRRSPELRRDTCFVNMNTLLNYDVVQISSGVAYPPDYKIHGGVQNSGVVLDSSM